MLYVSHFSVKRHAARNYVALFAAMCILPHITQTFQNRFIKYREKLFVFLDIDGIPWNNNAAERAIRHLAVQRKISGSFGQESTPQYLRLLGITQTCRFQNKSLLQFLLSGEKDIDKFKGSKDLKGWRMH
jgi:hypothetical protein